MRTPFTMEFGMAVSNVGGGGAGLYIMAADPSQAGVAGANEAQRLRLAPVAGPGQTFHVKRLVVNSATVPGVGVTDSYRMRINGADVGAGPVVLGAAALTTSGPVGATANPGQLISVGVTIDGASATTWISVTLEGEIVS